MLESPKRLRPRDLDELASGARAGTLSRPARVRRMQIRFPRAACIALCAWTLACSDSSGPTAPPSPPLPTTFALTGHISDLDTGRPLTGASIAILDAGMRPGRQPPMQAERSG